MFALAGPERESIRIMQLGSPVHRRGLYALGKPVHRRERSDAEPRDIPAQEDGRIDVHHHRASTPHGKSIGTGDRRAVQQRVDDYSVTGFGGLFDPELGEIRKFFGEWGSRVGDVYGESARRQSVLVQLANGAEIG